MNNRIGFGKRLLAVLVDVVILVVLVMILSPLLGGILGGLAGGAAGGGDAGMGLGALMGSVTAFIVVAPIISILYFLVEGFTGYTLGKFILGIRVGTADGKKADISLYLLRYALKNIGTIFTMVAGFVGISMLGTVGSILSLVFFVGCFFALAEKKQALHDIIVKTAVYPKADVS